MNGSWVRECVVVVNIMTATGIMVLRAPLLVVMVLLHMMWLWWLLVLRVRMMGREGGSMGMVVVVIVSRCKRVSFRVVVWRVRVRVRVCERWVLLLWVRMSWRGTSLLGP